MLVIAGLIAASMLPSRTLHADVAPRTCYREFSRAGTGVPMDKAAMDADRNLIVAVDELVAGPGTPRKGTAQSLGYVLHIANGDVYYQPETAKSRAQILAEVRAVSSSGVVPRDVGPLRLASFIAEGGAGLLKLRRAPPSRLAGGVRVVPCSSIENPLTH